MTQQITSVREGQFQYRPDGYYVAITEHALTHYVGGVELQIWKPIKELGPYNNPTDAARAWQTEVENNHADRQSRKAERG